MKDLLNPIKVCSCGKRYFEVPKLAKVNEDGQWWDCSHCGSSMLLISDEAMARIEAWEREKQDQGDVA